MKWFLTFLLFCVCHASPLFPLFPSELYSRFTSLFKSVSPVNAVRSYFPQAAPTSAFENFPTVKNFSVADFSTDEESLPKVRLGGRVVDLFNGWHFDDILMDAPDSIRPSNLVVFYDSSDEKCMNDFNGLDLDRISERELPPRSQLFISRYDMYAAPKRTWFEFTPEMDLKKRFNIRNCPELVFVSRKCNGETEWCSRGKDPEDQNLEVFGCDNFKEQCTEDLRVHETVGESFSLVKWVNDNIEREGRPKVSRFLGSFEEQGRWLQQRERTTCNTHFRNVYLSKAFPPFSDRGFKVLPIPKDFNDWILKFLEENQDKRKTEYWNAESTQMNFHENPTTFIDTDLVRKDKELMANSHLKPLLEEWTGVDDLKLMSFYGVREYHENMFLRQHVDKENTHVISVTLSLKKDPFTFDKNGSYPYKPWALRVTDWRGRQVAYDHPPGTMIMYESAKLPHGRPTRNEGGIHSGAFIHFKPRSVTQANEWDSLTDNARKYQGRRTENVNYRETKEYEGEFEWAENNVGDKSAWKKKGERAKDNGQRHVHFVNKASRPMRVFWKNPDGGSILQGEAAPGEKIDINSYVGHEFFWASETDEFPMLEFSINKRWSDYSFYDTNYKTREEL